MQDASRLRIRFDNGVTLRGSYSFRNANTVSVSLVVTDDSGHHLHGFTESSQAHSHTDGFISVVMSLEALKQYLLARNVNRHVGTKGMAEVRKLLTSCAHERLLAKAA